MSRIATRLSRVVCRQRISDPMSGFFMITAEALDGCVPAVGQGFEDSPRHRGLLARGPARGRSAARSGSACTARASDSLMWDFGMLLAEKTIGRYIPVRFFAFTLVGGAGVLVHMAVLAALRAAAVGFSNAQAVATVVAMIFNFWLNNLLTYRDRRLRGAVGNRAAVVHGGLRPDCVANVGIAPCRRTSGWSRHSPGSRSARSGTTITQLYTWGQDRSRDRH